MFKVRPDKLWAFCERWRQREAWCGTGPTAAASGDMSMAAIPKSGGDSVSRTLHPERRRIDRAGIALTDELPSQNEIDRLKYLLAFSARQLADVRSRNEQLMAVNSDLRCKLGEMTLRWVDLCNRGGR
jgi:hypothetical protein